jgi:hypothetical protein
MARYNEKRYKLVREQVFALLRRLVREKLSRAELNVHRTLLQDMAEWQALPRSSQADLLGITYGYIRALEDTKQFVWAHKPPGSDVWIPAEEFQPTGDYSKLPKDGSASAFVWAGTDKVWM